MSKSRGKFSNNKDSGEGRKSYDQDREKSYIPSKDKDTKFGNKKFRDFDNKSGEKEKRRFGSDEESSGSKRSSGRREDSRTRGADESLNDDFGTDNFRKGSGYKSERKPGKRAEPKAEGSGRDRKSPAGEDGFGRKRSADFKAGEGKKRKFSDSAGKDGRSSGSEKPFRRVNAPKAEPPVYDSLAHLPGERKKTSAEERNIRLNKYIADAGVCSRREADTLISAGEIKVNGEVITEMGYKVARKDTVTYKGQVLKAEKLVYVLLNKPKGFITTVDDPEDRKTVMNLVENACEERIYPVGRLDRNTTGLLLVTNDGELAKKLTHPSHNIKKIYQVDLDRPFTEEDVEKLQAGLMLEDGEAKVDEVAVLSEDRTILGVEIHSGRNRIVRRLFEHLGYEVMRLDRVMFAGLTKKDLPRGKWRYLSEKELIRLKHFK